MFLFLKTKNTKNIYRDSLLSLSKQITDTIKNGTWTNADKITGPVRQIVINGMGGSNLGPEIARSIFRDELNLPIIIDPGYDIASYINRETVYIVMSYSGSTEEPLVAYLKAKKRGALVIAVTAMGDNPMVRLALKHETPLFQFPTTANPSGQPRLGLGAALTAFIMVLNKLEIIKKSITKELLQSTKKLNSSGKKLADNLKSPARLMAKKIKNHEILLVSGPLFIGNLKTLRNQLCESAKNMAGYLAVSDMNHFALEGLQYPKNNAKRLVAIFFESKLDNVKITKRLELTKEVFRKNKVLVISHKLNGANTLEQGLELLQFSGFLSYYLSIINQVDPMKIPWVDWFKKQLATK